MLKIEEAHSFSSTADDLIESNPLQIEDLYDTLPKFTHEDIFYSLFNLEQAGYIDLDILWASGGIATSCSVNYMTFSGHEFLEKIRDSKHWSVIKKGLSAVRNYSLDTISSIASGVTSAAIAAYLENNPL